jgi:hypothetical protein
MHYCSGLYVGIVITVWFASFKKQKDGNTHSPLLFPCPWQIVEKKRKRRRIDDAGYQ